MAKRRVPNLLALAVLACVAERPMHPYEISTTLRTRGKEQSIKLNFGSLYSVVESLAKHGLIESRGTVRDGKRPERTVYAITADGRAEMEDWLAELLSTPKKEYTSLEAALSLAAGLAPDEVAKLLVMRATRLRMDIGSVDAGLAYTDRDGPARAVRDRGAVPQGTHGGRARVRHVARRAHREGRARRHRLVASRPRAAATGHQLRGDRPGPRRRTSERRPPRSHRSSTPPRHPTTWPEKPPGRCGNTGPEGTTPSRPT